MYDCLKICVDLLITIDKPEACIIKTNKKARSDRLNINLSVRP